LLVVPSFITGAARAAGLSENVRGNSSFALKVANRLRIRGVEKVRI